MLVVEVPFRLVSYTFAYDQPILTCISKTSCSYRITYGFYSTGELLDCKGKFQSFESKVDVCAVTKVLDIRKEVEPKAKATQLIRIHTYNVILKNIEIDTNIRQLRLDIFDFGNRKEIIIDNGTTLVNLPQIVYDQLIPKVRHVTLFSLSYTVNVALSPVGVMKMTIAYGSKNFILFIREVSGIFLPGWQSFNQERNWELAAVFCALIRYQDELQMALVHSSCINWKARSEHMESGLGRIKVINEDDHHIVNLRIVLPLLETSVFLLPCILDTDGMAS
ncbi:hypothetical protein VNO77_03129 [Canavalia gladiata]|uniref:Uncharacterized protein n=1 Tax=Canavalia gladiata TaxID=3824 RepID=A0AAN9R6J4_CANGL